MISSQPKVKRLDGETCFFYTSDDNTSDNTNHPLRTLEDITTVLKKTIEQRTTPVTYLLGFNEMYNSHPKEDDTNFVWGRTEDAPYDDAWDLTPWQAAEYWSKHVQPAGKETGLKLVPPTTKTIKDDDNTGRGLQWMVDFLKRCHDLDDCDIYATEKFAIHDYQCKEDFFGRRTTPGIAYFARRYTTN
jgi:hypothetical protein